MKFKSIVNFCIILFLITGILQISSIRSFAQSSKPLGIPTPTNEIGPFDFPFITAQGITVNQFVNGQCGFATGEAKNVCGVSTKNEFYWFGMAGGWASTFRHEFSSTVNNIEYNITGLNLNEVITVTVSNGTPSITASAGCYYDINGNILSGTRVSGDTGVKIKISSTQPYTWVQLHRETCGGSGCNITLDGNSVLASTASVASVPFSKWAIMIGFSLIFLLTAVRFKRIF
jgi:hypothetical protein